VLRFDSCLSGKLEAILTNCTPIEERSPNAG
jgi:hypothetical protein